ncbi:MAG: DNA polymerase III subunit gamma/tau [Bacteroidetes bacterium QS_8_68_15]|nr:MAG: DNA polymerase III subunit gamma/tau [Bacteroidetes bacterium QS_8_68_15]
MPEKDDTAASDNSGSEARYLVAARKYRPALFREVAAQEHVTDTLKNALRTGRLAHAYLFSGPRGVGKTTTARILAKAINCTTPPAEREDEAEPCRECESCRSFEAGRSLGIFELDAASNNKVDDIRELRETVRVPPQGAKKKVYIVDEVHMLSKQAFNALLKTLEEPPSHVLFIFATTEPHKVLPTIRSRCQRFDFRRIRAGRIAEYLRGVCREEGIDADEGSLMLLARKGDGALRDALSAFDQAVSLCGDTLRYDELSKALGVVDVDLYFQTTEHVRNGESAGMLRLVESLVGRGYDLQEFLAGLSEHLRNLMVACTMEDASLIEATDEMRERYAQTARHFSEDDLLRLLMLAGEVEDEVRRSAEPRLRLEMALLKMAALPRAADLQEALSRLRRLEQMAQGDGPLADLPSDPPAGASSSDAPPETNDETADRPEASDGEASGDDEASEPNEARTPHDDGNAAGEKNAADDARSDAPPEPDASPGTAAPPEEASSEGAPPGAQAADADEEDTSAPPAYDDLFGTPALADTDGPPPSGDGDSSPSPDDDADTPAAALAEQPGDGGTATADGPPPVEQLRGRWDTLVQEVRGDRIDVATCLRDATPVSVAAGALTVAVPNQFTRRSLMDQEAFLLDRVEKHLPDDTVVPSTLQLRIEEADDDGDAPSDDAPPDPHALMQRLREEHPVVQAIFDEFGGEMAW